MESYREMMKYFENLDPCIEIAIQKAQDFSNRMSGQWKRTSCFDKQEYVLDQKMNIHTDINIQDQENIAVSFHIWETQYDKTQQQLNIKQLHNHDFYEINYVYQGEIINHLLDNTIKQGKGQIVLMNPYAYHSPEIVTKDTMLFNIMIRKEFSTEVLSNPTMHNSSLTNLFLDTSLGMSPIHPYLVFENTPYTTLILHQMILEYYLNRPYSQQVISAKLIELWSMFARQRTEKMQMENLKNHYPETVSNILEYISNHCANVSLMEVAEKFGFSDNYLSHYIKKHTGYKFNEILLQFKMQNAIGYLLHTNFSLDKISELIGYNDISYFSKVFRKTFGVSPGKYRSQHK
ncbi:AraC family transcriptional regulator [Clostridium facile]|uniref:Helix-turn-helix domain-containing protein n=1 Tax=Clostridium facile TaxID=2763035 RepID=A0ABR7IRN2_9CLOT|nr:AraC family transcriptional regulator [Clostridium facile]MBC5787679.1 helix-turn-helix domain-containing protein [Clostridium facile]